MKKWDDGLRTTHIVTDRKVDDYVLQYSDLLKNLNIDALPVCIYPSSSVLLIDAGWCSFSQR